jgi:16S rRNA (uracil1498-N3)-methyltransferase
MTSPLFIADAVSVPPTIGVGQKMSLPAALQRHVAKSLRMENGDELMVSDGVGTRVTGTLIDAENGVVKVAEVTKEKAPSVRLCLVQALAKGGRDELAIEESTEIGVDGVLPWQADRSIVQWNGAKQAKAAKKWQSVLTAASEQSRRSRVPQLQAKASSKQLERIISQVSSQGDLVLVLHQDATQTWSQIEERCARMAERAEANGETSTIYVVVGPEGGISDKEIEQFTRVGAQAVVIGSTIMRASTAGPVALSLLSRALGRWS